MMILGIETSCDETAAAVVKDGVRILSSTVVSQVTTHQPYGGVVPELAARNHLEALAPTVQRALADAGIKKQFIQAVAVTQGPGLVGALLVGFCFAKAYAMAANIPIVGVNHLAGHVHSLFLQARRPDFPFACLLASGGHTALFYVRSEIEMDLMGQTRDDAAGEAFDKVAKMLGLGYPGGKIISDLAKNGDGGRIAFPRSYLDPAAFDFSFSGLKTAVSRYIQTQTPNLDKIDKTAMADIAASFQQAVVDVLADKLINAARRGKCRHIAVVGGVAANESLRRRLSAMAQKQGLELFMPPPSLCGDNAAMIAAAGFHHVIRKNTLALTDDVFASSRLATNRHYPHFDIQKQNLP